MNRLKSILIYTVCAFVSLKANAQIRIAKYYDNKQAALSFTFDDGLREQYTILFPKMKQLGIKKKKGRITVEPKMAKETRTEPKIKLDKEIFNHPLTLVLDFKPRSATQAGKPLEVKEKGEKFWFNFSPTKGKIVIE